jgi:hypothetical protein
MITPAPSYFKQKNIKEIAINPITWCIVVIAIGIGLRSIQYFFGSSMWLDELASADNIESRTAFELMASTLSFNQVAPVGFLLTQKLIVSLFGNSDLAHRFLPWVSSIAGIFLFWRLASNFLSGVPLVASLFLFCSSVSLIWLGSNAKQYSHEVAVTLFMVLAAYNFNSTKNKSWYWWIGILGGIGATLSFPGAVLAFTLLGILFFKMLRERTPVQVGFYIIAICWILGAVANVLYGKLVIANSPVFGAMAEHWVDGFPNSYNPLTIIAWLWQSSVDLIKTFLFYAPLPVADYFSFIVLAFSIAGVVYGIKKFPFELLILASPLIVAIGLAIFQIYPWSHRVAIHSLWPFLLLAALGMVALKRMFQRRFISYFLNGLLLLLPILLFIAVIVIGKPPFLHQPSEPVLKAMKKEMKPGDQIYVYSKSRYAI